MANTKKINQLDSRIPSGTDLVLIGDPSSGYSYKATIDELAPIVAPAVAPDRLRFIVGDPGYPADGDTTWTDADFDGGTLWLYRNKILQDWTDPGDGDSFFTLFDDTITFNPALSAGEKINLLLFKI
jgi:hypothetical protein